jgi:hypothetical protein
METPSNPEIMRALAMKINSKIEKIKLVIKFMPWNPRARPDPVVNEP